MEKASTIGPCLVFFDLAKSEAMPKKGPMVTTLQQKTAHSIKIEFLDEPVTSFGGLALAERMAERVWGFGVRCRACCPSAGASTIGWRA